MNPVIYALGIVASASVLGTIIELLRRRTLRERHAVWWLIAGFLALAVSIFPGMLTWTAQILGVAAPTNLIYFVSIAILVLVCLQHSAELTKLESKTRALTEAAVLNDIRLEQLQDSLNPPDPTKSEGAANHEAQPVSENDAEGRRASPAPSADGTER